MYWGLAIIGTFLSSRLVTAAEYEINIDGEVFEDEADYAEENEVLEGSPANVQLINFYPRSVLVNYIEDTEEFFIVSTSAFLYSMHK
jgi:hypothetical protein